jgi:hypothetical protein
VHGRGLAEGRRLAGRENPGETAERGVFQDITAFHTCHFGTPRLLNFVGATLESAPRRDKDALTRLDWRIVAHDAQKIT